MTTKKKKQRHLEVLRHAGPKSPEGLGFSFWLFVVAMIIAFGLVFARKAHAANVDATQVTVAGAIGWITPGALDAVLPPAKAEYLPVTRRIIIVLMSLGAGLGYEGIRRQVAHDELSQANCYASLLATTARITWSW